jgi:predicted PurR-regulated permease PerM
MGSSDNNTQKHLWEFRWVRDLIILGAIGVVLWVLFMARAILIPVLIGLVLAYIFNPIITWAHVKLKMPRWAATLILLVGLLGGATGLLLYLGPLAVGQASSLVNTTVKYVNKVSNEVPEVAQLRDQILRTFRSRVKHAEDLPSAWTEPGSEEKPETRPTTEPAGAGGPEVNTGPEGEGGPVKAEAFSTPDASGTQPAESQPASQPINGSDIFSAASKVNWSAAFSVLLGSLSVGISVVGFTVGVVGYALVATLLVAFCFFTFSCNLQRVIDSIALYVPSAHRAETFRIAKKMDLTIAAIVRGRLIQSAALMVMLSFGWCLAGVPYWLLLGVVAGALNILPYAASVGLPAAVLAVWVSRVSGGLPFDAMAIFFWPSLVYFVAQFIDGWVIETWVQGKATNLSPLGVLLSVLIGASIAGVAGMLLAIPVAACLKIVFEEFVQPRLMKYLHEDASGA